MGHFYYNFKMALKPSVRNVISILSLALGLALILVLLGNAMYESSYDSFYKNKDRLYLLTNGKYDMWIPDVIMPTLKTQVPEIEQGTYFRGISSTYDLGEDKFALTGLLVDTSFFDVFSFEVLRGNPREDFKEYRTIYLSESKATDLFGDSDPINKTLVRDSSRVYTVMGVFKDIPKNSIISYQLGTASNEFHFLEPLVQYGEREGWYGGGRNFAVALLREGVSREIAESKIKQIVDANYDPELAIERKESVNYILQPITDIYIGYIGVFIMVMIISFMAVLLIVVTALNYSLISVSAMASRLKEFAVHKCNGASGKRVVWMIFVQTAIQMLFASGLAVLIILAVQDQLAMFLMPIELIFTPVNILKCIVIVLLVVVVSAIIPSKIFANISVMSLFRSSRNSHQSWKKIMLFSQLFLSIVIIICSAMGYMQYDDMFSKDAGYKYDNLVYTTSIRFKNRSDYSKYSEELEKLSFVKGVSFSNTNIMRDFGGISIFEDGARIFYARRFRTTENYFDIHEMKILDGEPYRDGGDIYDIVVNETFVDIIKWDKNKSVIGNTFRDGNEQLYTVIGVVNDFETGFVAMESINKNALIMSPHISNSSFGTYSEIILKLDEISPQNREAIVTTIKRLNPNAVNVVVSSYNERRLYNYSDVKKPMDGIALSGIIIFLISIIGLYGYISNELQYRHREIALRKVYGASVPSVIKMIYRPIFIIMCLAIPLGVVGGYFGGDILLGSTLPYVVSMPWWIFLSVPLFILLFTYGIVAARTYKIASENPVKAIHE